MAPFQVADIPSLYQQTIERRVGKYDEGVANGSFLPYVYPWDAFPGLWLFLAILLFPRLSSALVKVLRYPLFAMIILHCGWVLKNCRSLNFADGYGIGLVTAWGVIMSISLILIKDVSTDFRRLEVRKVREEPEPSAYNDGASTSSASPSTGEVYQRKGIIANGSAFLKASSSDLASSNSKASYELVWQDLPSNLWHAFDWSIDLMTSFRGTNWNFRLPTLSPLKFQDPTKKDEFRQNLKTYPPTPSLRKIQTQGIRDFFRYYLVIDFVKTVMMRDPYFLGYAAINSPAAWKWLNLLPPSMIIFTTKLTRLLISVTGVVTALNYIFALSPVFFTWILPNLVSADTILKYTRAPLLEPSMYEPCFLPSPLNPLPHLLTHSLAGLWGKYWHQLFRNGISVPGTRLIESLNLNPKSQSARTIQLLVAFALSGSIHACASYTAFNPYPEMNPARPISGPWVFFVSQGVGIIIYTAVKASITKYLPKLAKKSPRSLKQTLNLLYALVWLYFTGPLLADDFARCGVWLFEPVPLSLFGLLGFGPKERSWWCWGGQGTRKMSEWVGLHRPAGVEPGFSLGRLFMWRGWGLEIY